MNIVITGGRTYRLQPMDWFWLGSELGKIMTDKSILTTDLHFHHGAAPGVDREVAATLAYYFPGQIVPHPANWDKFGKGAGPIRNREMAKIANLVLAFPGNDGTRDMIEAARKLDVEVRRSPTWPSA